VRTGRHPVGGQSQYSRAEPDFQLIHRNLIKSDYKRDLTDELEARAPTPAPATPRIVARRRAATNIAYCARQPPSMRPGHERGEQGPGDGCGEQQRVDAVHHTTMAGQQVAHVFDAEIALDQ